MLKFAVNLSMLFQDLPLKERFERAGKCGFKVVELLWPYELSIPEFKVLLEAHHLKLALFNTRAGEISKGEWGLAALPGRESEARAHIDEALEYAAGLDCPTVHVMAGVVKGLDRERCFETLKENVAYACEKAAPHGITITLEALCPAVKENYLYRSQYDTLQVVKDLNLSNLKVQYDFYHAQLVDGNVTGFLTENIASIGHVQIASVPDRTEFNHGELDGAYCLQLLEKLHYQGYIGLEYRKGVLGDEDSSAFAYLLNSPLAME